MFRCLTISCITSILTSCTWAIQDIICLSVIKFFPRLYSLEHSALLAIWTMYYFFINSETKVKSLSLKVNLNFFKDGNFTLTCLIKARIEICPTSELSLQNYEFVSSLRIISSNSWMKANLSNRSAYWLIVAFGM